MSCGTSGAFRLSIDSNGPHIDNHTPWYPLSENLIVLEHLTSIHQDVEGGRIRDHHGAHGADFRVKRREVNTTRREEGFCWIGHFEEQGQSCPPPDSQRRPSQRRFGGD